MNTDKSIIKVLGLYKTFQLKKKSAGFFNSLKSAIRPEYQKVEAVKNISFEVAEGELLAFIGPNGAGKSTTIKMLIGILYPSGGSLNVLGFNPSRDRQQLAYHVGSVFGQKPQLWYHLPPISTYQLFSRIYELDRQEYQKRLDFLVEAFEIKDLLDVPVRKMSLGQRMRCEIVASLLHRPKVVFLDEPTIGLDVIAKQHIREVIKHLNEKEKVTIFLTSHDAGDVETLAKRTMVVNHGQIMFDGSTREFKQSYIKSKIVELVMEGDTAKFNFPGGKIVSRSRYALKVELDTAAASVEKLLNYALKNFSIKDVNIYEPEMEEIIAAIYREHQT